MIAFPSVGIDNAHNMVLQVASTAGVVAALAWAASAVLPIVTSARAAWTRDHGDQRLVLSGVWLGALGYVVFLLAGISVIGSSTTFWIALALLAGVTAGEPKHDVRGWVRQALPWLAAVLLVTVTMWSATRFAADNRYMLARERVRGYDAGDPLEATRAAIALSPFDLTYRQHVVLLTQGFDPQAAKMAAFPALAIDPDDVLTLLLLTRTHIQLGETEEAARVLLRVESVAPTNPEIPALKRRLSAPTPQTP